MITNTRHGRRIGITVALAVSVAIGLGACSTAATPKATSSASTSKKPLVISLDSSVDLLDPQQFRTPAAQTATGSLVDQLIEQKYSTKGITQLGGADFQGALAKSWSYSKDRKVLTFTLRSGLKFADGSPLTAADVVWSLQRSMLGPTYIKALLPLAGVTTPDMIKQVDDLTVSITTTYANPLLDKLLAMQPTGILSEASGKANATAADPWSGAWFKTHDNSSGPYTVASYDPNVSLVLKPNPNYYDKSKVHNGGVTIQFVSDPSQRALLLKSGDLDLAQGIPLDQVKAMSTSKSLTVVSEPSNRLEYLGMNTSAAPFNNVKVRQAVADAIPFKQLQQQVMYGYATVSTGVVPKGMDTHSDAAGTFATNITKAKKLIADSGVGDITSTLYYKQSSAVEGRAAVFIQSSLAKIGITVDLKGIADADFTAQVNKRALPMYLNNFLGWGADPFYQMYYMAGSAAGTNFTSYKNPTLDAVLQSGFESADPAERTKISASAQKIIDTDMPFVPLYNPKWTFVVRNGVTGLTKDNTEQLRLQYLSK